MDVRAEKLLGRKGTRIESLETDKGGQVGNHADNGGKARQLMAVRIPSNETTGMTCRIMDIETGIRFRTNGRKETAPQVNAKKRRMDGRIESAGNGHTRGRGYARIEAEAGGAARRIYPNTIRDNRRRDGREGEHTRS